MTSRPAINALGSNRTPSAHASCPRVSIHQTPSGLPIISLTVSSKSNASMGRKKGKINSKLMVFLPSVEGLIYAKSDDREAERIDRQLLIVNAIAEYVGYAGGQLLALELVHVLGVGIDPFKLYPSRVRRHL